MRIRRTDDLITNRDGDGPGVVTPDECVEIAKTGASISVWPLVGGMPPEIGWKSVKLFAEKALPSINRLPLDI